MPSLVSSRLLGRPTDSLLFKICTVFNSLKWFCNISKDFEWFDIPLNGFIAFCYVFICLCAEVRFGADSDLFWYSTLRIYLFVRIGGNIIILIWGSLAGIIRHLLCLSFNTDLVILHSKHVDEHLCERLCGHLYTYAFKNTFTTGTIVTNRATCQRRSAKAFFIKVIVCIEVFCLRWS